MIGTAVGRRGGCACVGPIYLLDTRRVDEIVARPITAELEQVI
jgi:hypothetical protein